MIILQIRNPDDSIDTYNKIKIYRGDSQTGTFTLLTTVDIDITTRTDQSPGYTQYVDSTGTINNWFKVSYYNSSSSLETDLSDAFQGGTSDLDIKIRRRLKDSNSNSYFFSNDEIADFRDRAIQSLYPNTWIDTTYDVLITETNKRSITLPYTVFRADKAMMYDANGDYAGDYNAFFKVGNIIYAKSAFPVGYTMRFIITKPYTMAAECPFMFESYLLDVAQYEALKSMEMHRTRYYKYTTAIKPEGGNLPSLNRMLERLEVSIARRLNQLRRVRESSEINLV